MKAFQATITGPGYGYVYIMSYPHSDKVKIGHSLNPTTRAAEIGGTLAPEQPVLEASYWCSERREDVERKAHALKAQQRHNGEWFKLSVIEAISAIGDAARAVDVQIQLVFEREEHEAAARRKLEADQAAARRKLEADRARWASMTTPELAKVVVAAHNLDSREFMNKSELNELYATRLEEEEKAKQEKKKAQLVELEQKAEESRNKARSANRLRIGGLVAAVGVAAGGIALVSNEFHLLAIAAFAAAALLLGLSRFPE